MHRRNVQDRRQADLPQGGSIADPKRLFNSSLDGNARRAIDIAQGDIIDADALKALILAAVEANRRKTH